MDKPIIINHQQISYCEATGLIYVGEVPFTKEMLEKFQNLIEYSCEGKNQFMFRIQVLDVINYGCASIDVEMLDAIQQYVKENNLTVASDKDFK